MAITAKPPVTTITRVGHHSTTPYAVHRAWLREGSAGFHELLSPVFRDMLARPGPHPNAGADAPLPEGCDDRDNRVIVVREGQRRPRIECELGPLDIITEWRGTACGRRFVRPARRSTDGEGQLRPPA
jgi:hypothetical protein